MPDFPSNSPLILGVGNAFVDHIVEVSEEFVEEIDGEKGGMEFVTYERLCEILVKAEAPIIRMAGGSAANTIRALAHLGHRCAFTGRIGKDESSTFFLETFRQLGIESRLKATDIPTAQVACLVTPDKHRTLRTFMGGYQDIRASDYNPKDFADANIVYLEGYTLDYEDFTLRAMNLAKEAGAKIALGLASFEIVTRHHPFMLHLLEELVDIVFANDDEIKALYQTEPEPGCKKLATLCDIAVVSVGPNGCWVSSKGETFHHPAFKVSVVDTIGAGDLFAAGFLHGLTTHAPLKTCAYYANLCGGTVVQHHGAEPPHDAMETLKQQLADHASTLQ